MPSTIILETELQALCKIRDHAENYLGTSPAGTLAISTSNGTVQYQHRIPNQNRVYLKKEDPLIVILAQKDYATKALAKATRDIKQLNKTRELYAAAPSAGYAPQIAPCRPKSQKSPYKVPSLVTEAGNRPLQLKPKAQLPGIKSIYDQLHPRRKSLVKPYIVPDNLFIAAWEEESFPATLSQEECRLTTNRGDRVRSKSEVIIANSLFQHGIPYHYEPTLHAGDSAPLHPDFLLLNPATRQEILWEHFGLMDNPEYANNALNKISRYLQQGLINGQTLITTFESSQQPLDAIAIEAALKGILTP